MAAFCKQTCFVALRSPLFLPHYVEAMACALATSMHTSLPRPRILEDPKILNFIDIFAIENFAIGHLQAMVH